MKRSIHYLSPFSELTEANIEEYLLKQRSLLLRYVDNTKDKRGHSLQKTLASNSWGVHGEFTYAHAFVCLSSYSSTYLISLCERCRRVVVAILIRRGHLLVGWVVCNKRPRSGKLLNSVVWYF